MASGLLKSSSTSDCSYRKTIESITNSSVTSRDITTNMVNSLSTYSWSKCNDVQQELSNIEAFSICRWTERTIIFNVTLYMDSYSKPRISWFTPQSQQVSPVTGQVTDCPQDPSLVPTATHWSGPSTCLLPKGSPCPGANHHWWPGQSSSAGCPRAYIQESSIPLFFQGPSNTWVPQDSPPQASNTLHAPPNHHSPSTDVP